MNEFYLQCVESGEVSEGAVGRLSVGAYIVREQLEARKVFLRLMESETWFHNFPTLVNAYHFAKKHEMCTIALVDSSSEVLEDYDYGTEINILKPERVNEHCRSGHEK